MRPQLLSGSRQTLRDHGWPGRVIWIGLLVLASLYGLESVAFLARSPWDVPLEADGLVNPVPRGQVSFGVGSVIYAQRCAVCHGETGQGDGPSSLSLGVPPANLRDPEVMAQPDGRLFWKISVGRGPMPNWDLMLSEEDRWHVINYLRAMAAAP